MKSFNSNIVREVLRRFEFETFGEVKSTIRGFDGFSDNERLFNIIRYITTNKINEKCMQEKQKA